MGKNDIVKNARWINIKDLNIPEHKWKYFRKLRLPARIKSKYCHIYTFNKTTIDFKEEPIRVGRKHYCAVSIVPIRYPSCWIDFNIDEIEVFVSDDNLVALGCIILSE